MNPLLLAFVKKVITELMESLLTEDNLKAYGDILFDFVEEAVADSKTTIDDVTILPIIRQLRIALDIPDNDSPKPK